MNYAVDYRPMRPSFVARWEDGAEPIKVQLKLGPGQKRPAEIASFLAELKTGDVVYMPLGGAGGPLADRAHGQTGQVHQVPTPLIKKTREGLGWDGKDHDALVIAHLARTQPNVFYLFRPVDERILDLQFLVRRRQAVQTAVRIPAQLRLQQIARDEWLRRAPDIDLASFVKEQVEQEPFFQAAIEREHGLDEQIKELVKGLAVFREVFAPIDGVGPILGGRMIAEFTDIRRYPTPYKMLAYTGWHLRDGQVPKRRYGQRASWNHDLNEAFSRWHGFLLRCKDEAPWKAKYLQRKALEKQKHPEPVTVGYRCFRCNKPFSFEQAEKLGRKCPRCKRQLKKEMLYTPGHLHRRALRWTTQKLIIRWVWPQWSELEGLSTDY